MRKVEPPRQQLRERVARLRRDGERAVLTDHRDADRAGVEALGVRADDIPLDAAERPSKTVPKRSIRKL